jgi:hypothetical protein
MSIDWDLAIKVAGPIVGAILGAWFKNWFEGRPKLVVFYGHRSLFDVNNQGNPQDSYTVHTHAIVIHNNGKRTAKNVRIGHATLPPNYKVFPEIQSQIVDLPNGGKEILIPNFVAGKQITISYLYFPPMLWSEINTYVESDEGSAKVIEVLPTPQLPKWQQKALWVLIVIGGITVLYLFLSAGTFLLSLT